MDFLPIFLDVRAQPCLVVGGGDVAARKSALLLRAGAQVTVLAPALAPAFDADLAAQRIAHRAARFEPQDVGGYYRPDDAKAVAAMRPSATLNGIIDAMA